MGRFHQTLCAKENDTFGEKFAVQFHQLNVKAKIMSKFAKIACCLPNAIRQKKLLILFAQKILAKMLMKSTPGGKNSDLPTC